MGLAFPSAGKFFLVNNGPYFHNYDLPPPADGNVNLFFNPGPARAWIGRSTLEYDRWIPSVLFLVHYLPDGPRDSQWINAASLMLGHNGIWGDLTALDEGDIQCWRGLLDSYKIVRDDVARAYPARSGQVGASPEIHEKIAPNGRGLVAIFASKAGVYEYVTRATGLKPGHPGMDGVEILSTDDKGRAHIRATFERPSARIVFFHE
jgi:alpha-galactosidase